MTDLREIQLAELTMLKAFIRVCEEHHLTYFAVGGTLIGAIRHQGFIPWDDDIDLALPRPDFDKLVEIASTSFHAPYFFQTYKSDKNYRFNYAKLRNSDTCFVEKVTQYSSMNHGIFLDIYPLDGYKKPNESIIGRIRHISLWGHEFIAARASELHPFRKHHFFTDLRVNTIALLFKPLNAFHWQQRLADRRLKKYPYTTSPYVLNYYGQYNVREIASRDWFQAGQLVPFEDIHIRVPINYDAYLRRIYGNYMQLPPVEKQRPHHLEICSLDVSYRERLAHLYRKKKG